MDSYLVYVIWNHNHHRYYIGQTSNLEIRILQHNDPENTLSRFTKRFSGEWVVIHTEEFSTRKEALAREKALKSGQGRLWLAENVLPGRESE